MHFTRRFALLLALSVAILAALAGTASASTQTAAGSFVESPETILEERQSGGNTFIHLTREAAINGTYSGHLHADQWIVIHADGSFNFHQLLSFTGVVCGQPATLEIRVVGQGDFTENVLTGTYSVVGPNDVGNGSGKLVGEPGVGGSYEGNVHCG